MKPRQITIITTLLLVALLVRPTAAWAHIEGHMPDSVAEMEYRIFLEFKPNDVTTRVKLALVLMNQDKLAEAENEFKRCLTASPRNVLAHLGLSQLRSKQHKTEEALELIRNAVKIDPENPAAYLQYGKVLEADNRPLEAQEMYKRGLAKLPDNPRDPESQHARQPLENALKRLKEKSSEIAPVN